jgi:hypothetical protein
MMLLIILYVIIFLMTLVFLSYIADDDVIYAKVVLFSIFWPIFWLIYIVKTMSSYSTLS